MSRESHSRLGTCCSLCTICQTFASSWFPIVLKQPPLQSQTSHTYSKRGLASLCRYLGRALPHNICKIRATSAPPP
eukprot:2051284-Rhodomonas_salina.2